MFENADSSLKTNNFLEDFDRIMKSINKYEKN